MFAAQHKNAQLFESVFFCRALQRFMLCMPHALCDRDYHLYLRPSGWEPQVRGLLLVIILTVAPISAVKNVNFQPPRTMRLCGASIDLVAMVIVSPRKAAACSLLTFVTSLPLLLALLNCYAQKGLAAGDQIHGTAVFRQAGRVPLS